MSKIATDVEICAMQLDLHAYPRPRRGDVYKHWKGGTYLVTGTSLHEETLEIMVHYRSLEKRDYDWTRPLTVWEELVPRPGEITSGPLTVPRFVYTGVTLDIGR